MARSNDSLMGEFEFQAQYQHTPNKGDAIRRDVVLVASFLMGALAVLASFLAFSLQQTSDVEERPVLDSHVVSFDTDRVLQVRELSEQQVAARVGELRQELSELMALVEDWRKDESRLIQVAPAPADAIGQGEIESIRQSIQELHRLVGEIKEIVKPPAPPTAPPTAAGSPDAGTVAAAESLRAELERIHQYAREVESSLSVIDAETSNASNNRLRLEQQLKTVPTP